MNLNTLVTVAGFILTIAAGVAVMGEERAENRMRHTEAMRRIELLEQGRIQNASAIQSAQVQAATVATELTQLRRELSEVKQDLREAVRLLRENGSKP